MKRLFLSTFLVRDTDLGRDWTRPLEPCFGCVPGAGTAEGMAPAAWGSSRARWQGHRLDSLLISPSGTVRGRSFIRHVISEEENDSGS